jgi:hypothetical protein
VSAIARQESARIGYGIFDLAVNNRRTLNTLLWMGCSEISISLRRPSSGLQIGMPMHDSPSVTLPPKDHRRS